MNVRTNEREGRYMSINKAKSCFYEETNGNDTPRNVQERQKKSTNKQYWKWKRNRLTEVAGVKR